MRKQPRPESTSDMPSTRLGDWTANLVQVGRIKLVLAMNDQTRHLVVLDAAPYATLPERFPFALHRSLVSLGVPPDIAAEEIDRMEPMRIDSAKSRSVLSALSQVAWRLELEVRAGMTSAAELTDHLADNITTIEGKLGFPIDHVRKAFGLAKRRRAKDLPDVTLH